MINRPKLLQDYLKWVDLVTEECDWKTHFTPDEIVYKISELIDTGNYTEFGKSTLTFEKVDEFRYDVKNPAGSEIGRCIYDINREYYFQARTSGYFSDYILTEISNFLHKLNARYPTNL